MNEFKKVFVGLSGGVDSSVAAYLLKKKNYDVVGVHLRCWNVNGCDLREAEDARRVANHLDIPFYVLNLEEEYKKAVVDYMVDGYRKGLTPNPDVMCNKEIKFGLFLKKALEMGADYIATGHYVKIEKSKIKNQNDNSKFKIVYKLFQAKDANKDQSYFLWTLTQEQLRHCLFPVGDYLKSEVRALAKEVGLPTAEKKDSQGICFVGKVTLSDFLSQYIKEAPGNILTTDGRVVGTHPGVQFYTIGQRQGLGVALNTPHYVAERDTKTNTVVLAPENDQSLYRKEITLSSVNFINHRTFQHSQECKNVLVRIRYRQPLAPATLYKILDTPVVEQSSPRGKARYEIHFAEPQKFVAPGQSAVFYSQEGEMLGGGIIS
ncbi:MAG: tRNA 2-thiouridine(34) synthase MnmA [Candidatus Colwellbacteria bacterium]|nr:tRNA 2-thiouridine(34) synthase MnmA [Candidatus Colwellbacteria bacterium]